MLQGFPAAPAVETAATTSRTRSASSTRTRSRPAARTDRRRGARRVERRSSRCALATLARRPTTPTSMLRHDPDRAGNGGRLPPHPGARLLRPRAGHPPGARPSRATSTPPRPSTRSTGCCAPSRSSSASGPARPEGATVVLELTGPVHRTVPVTVVDGRAKVGRRRPGRCARDRADGQRHLHHTGSLGRRTAGRADRRLVGRGRHRTRHQGRRPAQHDDLTARLVLTERW